MDEKKSEESWRLPLYKIYTDDEDVNLITKIIKDKVMKNGHLNAFTII